MTGSCTDILFPLIPPRLVRILTLNSIFIAKIHSSVALKPCKWPHCKKMNSKSEKAFNSLY